jgi:hypothetical protein
MKKIALLPIIICLFSCQKSTDVLLPELTSNAKKLYNITEVTEPYADRMWNTCLNEYIALSGTVTYLLKESIEGEYYIDYRIDLDKVIGVGEVSGIIFKGGGRIEGKVKMSNDGVDVKGSVYYNVRYTSPGGNKMNFTEHAILVENNNVVKVHFINQDATCELE